MSVKFILGASGSGKTASIYQQIIESSLQDPGISHFLVVPEQFTLQAAADLIRLHPKHGLLNIDVLSFNRLAYRVLEKTGVLKEDILTETGKNLLLRRAALLAEKDLTVFAGRMDRQGCISEVKSLLSEFASYEVNDEQLDEMIGEAKDSGNLYWKLKDFRTLRKAFDELRKNRFRMSEEVPSLFAQAAEQASLLQGSRVWLDGFTGFTPVQLTALRAILKLAEEIKLTVTIDPAERIFGKIEEHELFALSKRTIRQVSMLAEECGVTIDDPLVLDGSGGRFAENEILAWLEKNFLRPGVLVNNAETLPVSLHISASPAAEALFAAATAQRLVLEEGYRYGEIAVICGSLLDYEPYLARAMADCNLPCFIDRKVSASLNPCLEFVRSAMEIARTGFSQGSVMRFLRTGLAGISAEDTDRLENYLLQAGIRSKKRWETEWKAFDREPDEEALAKLNRDREQLLGKLGGFLLKFAKGRNPVGTYVDAILTLLRDFGIDEALLKRREELLDIQNVPMLLPYADRHTLAMEYAQICPALLKVLDEEKTIIGREVVSRKEFIQILEAGLDEVRIGLLPPGQDRIYAGDMTRTRLDGIKALIFLGMNDGWVPLKNEKHGILTEQDREFLKARGLVLSPGLREDAYIQRYYLYLCLTKPSRRLFLSASKSDGSGKTLRPAYVMRLMKKMFPSLTVTDEEANASDWRKAPSPARFESILAQKVFTAGLKGEFPGELKDLLTLARDTGFIRPDQDMPVRYGDVSFRDRIELLSRAASFRLDTPVLSREAADSLYAGEPALSASRADSYASCPYQFFARYGLGLTERKELAVRPTDTGTLFHETLERFSRTLTESDELDWFTLSEEAREKLLDESFDEACANQGLLFEDSERNRFTAGRVKEILRTSVWGMMKQVQAGSFVPSLFENEFREQGLRGKIDRIDLAETGDTLWVKVVDYKSGSARFDLALLYDGKQLQLPVYLFQTMKLLKDRFPDRQILPAGVFYSHLTEPVLADPDLPAQTDFVSENERLEKLLVKLRPDGLTNAEPEALRLFAADPEVRNLVVPVPKIRADGTAYKDAFITYTPHIQMICGYTAGIMKKFTGQIAAGRIAPEPYVDSGKFACEFCVFSAVCGYEKRLPGAGKRRKCTLSKQDILERMRREDGSEMDS